MLLLQWFYPALETGKEVKHHLWGNQSPGVLHVLWEVGMFGLWTGLDAQRRDIWGKQTTGSCSLLYFLWDLWTLRWEGRKNKQQLHHSKILICQIILSKTVCTLRVGLHVLWGCSRHPPSVVVSLSYPQPPGAFCSLFSALGWARHWCSGSVFWLCRIYSANGYFRPSPELAVSICKCGRSWQSLLWATCIFSSGSAAVGLSPHRADSCGCPPWGCLEESRARCSNLIV